MNILFTISSNSYLNIRSISADGLSVRSPTRSDNKKALEVFTDVYWSKVEFYCLFTNSKNVPCLNVQ